MAKRVHTYNLSEPLHGVLSAKVDINTVDGNLTIDGLTGGSELASGALQYIENQVPPTRSMTMSGSRATLTLKSGNKGQSWIRLPWAACNGATAWQIHLNSTVSLDIAAHSGGGNVILDLTGLTVTHLTADTGGGNMEVILPDTASGLQADIKTGAGNVTVHVPSGAAVKVHATSGLGKVIMDAPLHQIDKKTYQSPDYASAVDKLEITAISGAGNVSIKEKTGHPAASAIRS